MNRFAILPLIGLVMATPVQAKRVAAQPAPVVRALRANAVIVGKVTSMEKGTVDVANPGEAAKVPYQVAVLKVESLLSGPVGVTHVKVGFPAPADPNKPAPPRRGYPSVTLVEGQSGLYFLTQHPTAGFYVINPMMPPVDASAENYKTDLESVKHALAVLAEPMNHLKAEKADDRYFAAAVLILKYRTYPEGAAEVDQVKVAPEETQMILKALADAPDWSRSASFPIPPTQIRNYLALTEKDGWKNPVLRPGVAEDVNKVFKDAFTTWLAGPGQTYQITKMTPKK